MDLEKLLDETIRRESEKVDEFYFGDPVRELFESKKSEKKDKKEKETKKDSSFSVGNIKNRIQEALERLRSL
jgi:hypothetical protein